MNKITIIYDTTAHCPMNCKICCMGATTDKSTRAKELTLEQKLDLARQVKELQQNGYEVHMDLSGGEIFTNIPDHTRLLTELSAILGKDRLGVSCSGYALAPGMIGYDPELAGFLSKTVRDVEMTMDVVPGRRYDLRPNVLSKAAAEAVVELKRAGCKVGLQIVASALNNDRRSAEEVFQWACDHDVDSLSILRFYASGRGAKYAHVQLSDAQCEEYVHMMQQIAEEHTDGHKPEVDFHYLMPGHAKHTNICRCVRHSIGILPNGDVTACFWALDSSTGVIEDKFLLGNVTKQSLLEILNGEKARYWSDREHCCELCPNNATEGGAA